MKRASHLLSFEDGVAQEGARVPVLNEEKEEIAANEAMNTERFFTSPRMEQQWNRIQGARMVRSGFLVADVARFFRVSSQTVVQWVSRFDQFGEKGMHARSVTGRPPKVSAGQVRWIAAMVRDHTPDQLYLESGLWTHKLVARLVEREWGLTLSRPTLINVMTHLGLIPARPIHLAHQGDEGWSGHWAAAVPALWQRAKDRGRTARILFADEARLPGSYYAPEGAAEPTRPVRMLSALSMMGELQFMLVQSEVDAKVFRTFLQQLMIGTGQPVVLAVDSQPVHQHPLVEAYVQSTHGALKLHHLPPYP
jgi:transposase